MNSVFAGLAIAPGLALGSFLNVVAARVPRRQSVVSPGSACPHCSTPIRWNDNVPVLSFFLLHGHCRTCNTRISWKYPVVEIVTAMLVAGCIVAFGISIEAALAVFICATLVAVSVADLERRVIPNRIVLPAASVVVVLRTVLDPSPEWAIGAIGTCLLLLIAAVAYPGGMGMGDVKLGLLLGAALGRVVPVAMMVAVVSALVPAAVLFARHGLEARKMGIPFGPFLAVGCIAGLFAGNVILDSYLTLL